MGVIMEKAGASSGTTHRIKLINELNDDGLHQFTASVPLPRVNADVEQATLHPVVEQAKLGSKAKMIFIFLGVALTLATVCSIAFLGMYLNKPTDSSVSLPAPDEPSKIGLTTCNTSECVEAANLIASAIDYKADPCEDFYQFACGKFIKDHHIQPGQTSFSEFAKLQNKIDQELSGLMVEPIAGTDSMSAIKVKTFVQSCMDYEQITKVGAEPLKDLLTELGGWPLIKKDWSEKTFDLMKLIQKLNGFGQNSLFGLAPIGGARKTLVLVPDETFLKKSKIYNFNRDDPFFRAYEKLIADLANLLGQTKSDTLAKDVKDLVNIEIELTNLTDPRLPADITLISLQTLYTNAPNFINWREYVETLLRSPQIGISDLEDEEDIMTPISYFHGLQSLINMSSRRALANYMLWGIIFRLYRATSFGDKFKAPLEEFMKFLGTARTMSRQVHCEDIVKENLNLAISNMFIKRFFDKHAKQVALEMTKELKESFLHLLKDNEWMDDESEKAAEDKIKLMNTVSGYYDEYANDTYVNSVMNNITFEKNNFFQNFISIIREDYFTLLRTLRSTLSCSFPKTPIKVNAMNIAIANEIYFPAAIMQAPLYSKNFPKSMNYGAIGVITGHEITHGFDTNGRFFNKHGAEQEWWTNTTIANFREKAFCFFDQYSKYSPRGSDIKVNGILTLGENIADNGGLRQAYWAYRNWVKKEGKEEPLLPNLNFTGNQIFFLRFAQAFCEKATKEFVENKLIDDEHSPKDIRIIGALQNFKEFSENFNCPAGSYMNPEKKCLLW